MLRDRAVFVIAQPVQIKPDALLLQQRTVRVPDSLMKDMQDGNTLLRNQFGLLIRKHGSGLGTRLTRRSRKLRRIGGRSPALHAEQQHGQAHPPQKSGSNPQRVTPR
ncbi:hypothetical protein ACP_1133 [Acidobacterium capsulatum ATCC 51196]|uniref:Uncharacterized protein n=1 Tax=Acidobacterium capsulatum (strain ATCC 51196 / DSM 11244 / BCRC 80197 / JCM 7670 / NBRC 15755 / NCIMB 13165 / 161) TaxID=240015 RepID=C1F4A4_ACIC5|nr:hypothetical protein ACP_1133 [Acidobacterium capsulatum ATCC 51196]